MGSVSVSCLRHFLNRIYGMHTRKPTESSLVKIPNKRDSCVTIGEILDCYYDPVVFCNNTLSRIKKEDDKKIRDKQASFRQERSCVDQMPILTISIEQTSE